jgi:hypothetical protein
LARRANAPRSRPAACKGCARLRSRSLNRSKIQLSRRSSLIGPGGLLAYRHPPKAPVCHSGRSHSRSFRRVHCVKRFETAIALWSPLDVASKTAVRAASFASVRSQSAGHDGDPTERRT